MVTYRATEALTHLERLLWLEKELGHKIGYKVLEPSSFSSTLNDLELQRAGKQVAAFLGFDATTFIIGRAKQETGVAGHIELNGRVAEVFIEVADEVASSRDSTLATLAHEITHHYLEISGFPATSTKEYELFTDTAAIFLGMGKLILGGAGRVGYLSREQVGVVYVLVCRMRRIPQSTFSSGLSSDNQMLLSGVEQEYGWLFDDHLHAGIADGQLIAQVNSRIEEVQRLLAELESDGTRLLTAFEQNFISRVCEAHDRVAEVQSEVETMREVGENHDPCLRYLRTLKAEIGLRNHTNSFDSDLERVRQLHRDLTALSRFIESKCSSFSIASSAETTMTKCRRCNSILRVRSEIDLRRIRCPNCGYKFHVKTGKPALPRKSRFFAFLGSAS